MAFMKLQFKNIETKQKIVEKVIFEECIYAYNKCIAIRIAVVYKNVAAENT